MCPSAFNCVVLSEYLRFTIQNIFVDYKQSLIDTKVKYKERKGKDFTYKYPPVVIILITRDIFSRSRVSRFPVFEQHSKISPLKCSALQHVSFTHQSF